MLMMRYPFCENKRAAVARSPRAPRLLLAEVSGCHPIGHYPTRALILRASPGRRGLLRGLLQLLLAAPLDRRDLAAVLRASSACACLLRWHWHRRPRTDYRPVESLRCPFSKGRRGFPRTFRREPPTP